MNLRDLVLRVRALATPRRVEQELDEELAFHIEREAKKHIAAGLSPADARARALARFGPMALAADECRDARGTAGIDTLARDILYAFRAFRREPLTALTIIGTVALGLALVTVVFAVYNTFFLRVDAVHRPGELFAVERPTRPGADAWLPFTRPELEAIRRETSVFTDAFGMLSPGRMRIEGGAVTPTLVTGNFFQVLGVDAALGRTLTPEDDEPFSGRPVIVLSHMGWNKLFAGDPAAIGRSVLVNGATFEVVGIMPDGFRGLLVGPPDFWAPLALVAEFRRADAGREDEIPLGDVVGRLRPGLSPQAAMSGLAIWASGRPGPGALARRPMYIALEPRQGSLSADAGEALLEFSPIFFAFGLVLMIGCTNVANLLLARGVSRQREIGVRLALGASRQRIIRQLLTESLLLALVAAACALVVSRLLVAGVMYATTTFVPPEVLQGDLARWAPVVDWRVVAFLLVGAIVSTAFFGLVPALHATRLELVQMMRGEVTSDARPGRARHALIAAQVGASALLLICAAVFLRGALTAATADPGFRTSDTVTVPITDESRRAALVQAVTVHPTVAAVAAASASVLALAETSVSHEVGPDRPAESSRAPVDVKLVSPDYFDVLGIDLVRGRGFTASERTPGAGVIVVSEQTVRRLWPNREPVGQVVRLQSEELGRSVPPVARAYTVIGVARDVGTGEPGLVSFDIGAGVYVPTDPESSGTSLTLRVRGDPDLARLALLERLMAVDPALGEIRTLRAMAGMQMFMLRSAFWITAVVGGLALVLTVLGLFSVLSYVIQQRAKEFGVRMALGATMRSVVSVVLSQALVPVGIGLLAGGALAAALALALMSTRAASQIEAIVDVLDPVAYAASLLVIVTACVLAASVPTLRATRIDPVATLRRD